MSSIGKRAKVAVGVFALTAFLVGCALALSAFVTLTLWVQNDAQVRCYDVRPPSVVVEGNSYGTSYGFSLLPFGVTCTYWEPDPRCFPRHGHRTPLRRDAARHRGRWSGRSLAENRYDFPSVRSRRHQLS